MIKFVYKNYGINRIIEFIENIKNLRFRSVIIPKISICNKNLQITKEKPYIKHITNNKYKLNDKRTIINYIDIYIISILSWEIFNKNFINAVQDIFFKENIWNYLYLISISGARGNWNQIHQLIGIRGIMIDPFGRLVESTIIANFQERIILNECRISCYGARKRVIHTAIRTADSGYLTRPFSYNYTNRL